MKFLLNKYKLLFIIYIPFFIFVLVICLYKTDYSVTTTGSITNVSSYMVVEDGYHSEGSLNSIFVYSSDHSTIFQKWCGRIDKNAEVEKMGVNSSKFSQNELNKMGLIQKNQSLEASIIYAYKKAMLVNSNISLDYDFNGHVVSYIIKKDNQQFEIGDLITHIDGALIDEENESILSLLKEGTSVRVIRDSKEINIIINSDTASFVEDGRLYSRLLTYKKYHIKNTSPNIKVYSTGSLGPSAGLMQALTIYNSLIEEDITNGYKISGTGMIYEDGRVGAIGGVKEKVVAAFKNNTKLFICPKDNYDEAYAQYQKLGSKKGRMKMISVSTFEEALEALYENCR